MTRPRCDDLVSCCGEAGPGLSIHAYELRPLPARNRASNRALRKAAKRVTRKMVGRNSNRGSVPSSRATTPTGPPAVEEASGGDAPLQEPQNSGDPRAAAPQPPPDVHDMLSAALSRISVLEEVIAATRSENVRCQPSAREEPLPVGHSNASQVPHLIPQEPTSYIYPTHALGVHPAAPASTRQALSGRDEIPVFYGETPASQALQRNREVEAWISTIEMLTQPATDEALIRMARGRARGYAQMVLLGPMFQGITSWQDFKAKLRVKFRGVSTPEHFFEMLSQSKMIPGQSPLDYFQAVEMAILQGAKDYPYEVGDIEALLRRTFTAGLPTWLRHQLLLLDFATTSQMAQKCQAAWDATVGIKTFLPTIRSATRSSHGLYPSQSLHQGQPLPLGFAFPVQHAEEITPPLEFYSDGPLQMTPTPLNNKQVGTVQQVPRQKHVTFDSPPTRQQMDVPNPLWSRRNNSLESSRRQHGSPGKRDNGSHRREYTSRPHRIPSTHGNNSRTWCEVHRREGHDTSQCRLLRMVCYGCGESGHLVALCPFQPRRSGQNSHPAGGSSSPRERTERITDDTEGQASSVSAGQREDHSLFPRHRE